ncbi:MAG: YicC family protein [Bacteroidetes bacterium]|nr:MAG: YicC family protein [Bacteroidota bacterium]
MIQSMTGYGAATLSSPNYKVTVELKSLNSKFLEATLKLPRVYLKYENRVRAALNRKLERGKVMMVMNVEVLNPDKRTLNVNRALVKRYYKELTEIAEFLGIPPKIDLALLLELPEVIPTEVEQEDPEEWQLVEQALSQAIDQMVESRKEEGAALDRDLARCVAAISAALEEVKVEAPRRLEDVRSRIDQAMVDLRRKVEIDRNRFEQELIFYVEKLDINEEIVRLSQHLTFFEELRQSDENNGKQLQFLSQEMGREINTIGSKANDAHIQRLVVGMKDELDKIKEQVLNIL